MNMAALEKVMQMQGQGMSESQIINALRQEGVSPKEVYDALTQSQIKSELSQNPGPEAEYETDNMKQSMNQEEQTNYAPEEYVPEQPQQEYPEYQNPPVQEYAPEYQEYQAPQQQTTDIETINEIAEQIVEEKSAELKKQVSEIRNFFEC